VQGYIEALREFGRIRQREGASHRGVCRDLEMPHRYVKTFIVSSWAEHLRQHERITRADSVIENRLLSYIPSGPSVRHLLYR